MEEGLSPTEDGTMSPSSSEGEGSEGIVKRSPETVAAPASTPGDGIESIEATSVPVESFASSFNGSIEGFGRVPVEVEGSLSTIEHAFSADIEKAVDELMEDVVDVVTDELVEETIDEAADTAMGELVEETVVDVVEELEAAASLAEGEASQLPEAAKKGTGLARGATRRGVDAAKRTVGKGKDVARKTAGKGKNVARETARKGKKALADSKRFIDRRIAADRARSRGEYVTILFNFFGPLVAMILLFVGYFLFLPGSTASRFLGSSWAYFIPSPTGDKTVLITAAPHLQGYGSYLMALNLAVLDTLLAWFLVYNVDLVKRWRWGGKVIGAIERRSRALFDRYPKLRKVSLVFVAFFVLIPFQGSGGFSASIIGRLMGLKPWKVLVAVASGALAGTLLIAYMVDAIKTYVSTPVQIVIFVVFVALLTAFFLSSFMKGKDLDSVRYAWKRVRYAAHVHRKGLVAYLCVSITGASVLVVGIMAGIWWLKLVSLLLLVTVNAVPTARHVSRRGKVLGSAVAISADLVPSKVSRGGVDVVVDVDILVRTESSAGKGILCSGGRINYIADYKIRHSHELQWSGPAGHVPEAGEVRSPLIHGWDDFNAIQVVLRYGYPGERYGYMTSLRTFRVREMSEDEEGRAIPYRLLPVRPETTVAEVRYTAFAERKIEVLDRH